MIIVHRWLCRHQGFKASGFTDITQIRMEILKIHAREKIIF